MPINDDDFGIKITAAQFANIKNVGKQIQKQLNELKDLKVDITKVNTDNIKKSITAAVKEAIAEGFSNVPKIPPGTSHKPAPKPTPPKIFDVQELNKQQRIYESKVFNSVNKMKKQMEKTLSSKGYSDIEITGIEKANGQVVKLTANVTDAHGEIKKLNFELGKIQFPKRVRGGLIQTEDVKVSGNISTMAQKTSASFNELKSKWKEQGILSGDFAKKIEQIETGLANVSSKSGLDKVQADIRSANTEAANLIKTLSDQKKLSGISEKQANTARHKIDVGSYTTKYVELQTRLQKFGDTANKTEVELQELDAAYKKLIAPGQTNDALVANMREFQTACEKAENKVKQLSIAGEQVDIAKNLKFTNRVEEWAQKNKKALSLVGDELERIKREASGADQAKLSKLEGEFKSLQNQARAAGKLGNSFTQGIIDQAKKFSQWVSVTTVVMSAVHSIKQMSDAVYEIDTAMTNLYKVTDETDIRYNRFLVDACKNAKELGRTVSSLVEQTANWSKLGYSLDEAEKLAKISSIYSNVGEVDDDTAVSDMVTAMKAFNIEASDAITIVDSLNELGNKYATSARDLGEGLSRSASSMATAGTDLYKTLAMLTGGAEITQNANEFGNMLKIGSMRIRGMKGQLEELNEEVDESVNSISKVQTQILNLTHGKVNIFGSDGEFKEYYGIMEEISEIYNDLTSTEQASLSEILFGKQRGNQGAALIQAFQSGQIQKAYNDVKNSAGSAYEEQRRWMDSLEAKSAQFQAAFQSLSNTVLNSGLLKFFVDLGTSGVSGLDAIINKIGILTPLLGGVGIAAFIKDLDCPVLPVRGT